MTLTGSFSPLPRNSFEAEVQSSRNFSTANSRKPLSLLTHLLDDYSPTRNPVLRYGSEQRNGEAPSAVGPTYRPPRLIVSSSCCPSPAFGTKRHHKTIETTIVLVLFNVVSHIVYDYGRAPPQQETSKLRYCASMWYVS